jgi:hypothetical protein
MSSFWQTDDLLLELARWLNLRDALALASVRTRSLRMKPSLIVSISGSRRPALQSVTVLKHAPSGYPCIERHVVGFLSLTHLLWIQASAACPICATSFGMPLFSTGLGPLDTPGLGLSASSSYHRDSGSGLLSEAARTCSYSTRKPSSSHV